MKIPTPTEAISLLKDAETQNPGLWAEHSKVTASTAKLIAEKCPSIDEDTAFTMGLLHDIGRYDGWKHFTHILDGYHYLMKLGYTDAASICLTHSFPISEVGTYHGEIDCSTEDVEFVSSYLINHKYSDYDKLIQLCDAISLPHGTVLMEKRLVDVVMRYGLAEWTLRKWKAYFDLKQYFDELAGCNIYSLFPNIIQDTFEW